MSTKNITTDVKTGNWLLEEGQYFNNVITTEHPVVKLNCCEKATPNNIYIHACKEL